MNKLQILSRNEVFFLICVYAPDSTDFSGNGLGPVSPLSCTVTETLNGEWELTLEHPLDDAGKWRRLVEGCILRAPVPAAMTPGITMITQATPEVRREIWKVRTNGSRLMLRSGTGTRYKIIGKYKNGTEVVLLEKTTSSWYKMLTPDGKQGYHHQVRFPLCPQHCGQPDHRAQTQGKGRRGLLPEGKHLHAGLQGRAAH